MSTEDHTKPPAGRDILFLALGVIGIGTSGPVIALSTMPVPSLIFWRNLGGAVTMIPFALRLKQWRTSEEKLGIKLSAFAGICLALHFLCFFAAMRLTSVAAGVAITTMQPVFAAIYLRFKGGHIPRRAWVGMAIAFASVLLITGVDLQISLRAFTGDLLALSGAALSAGYVLIGSQAQRRLATSSYTSVCYLVCALTVLPVALIGRFEILHFEAHQWWLLIALIVGAQMLGHTMFNLTLKRVSPAVVSLVVFFEVPVSAILALWWMGQSPPGGTIPGIIGLLIGCGVFVFRGRLTS
jgi:drug/metabolite transporter (DMT)-like permease